MRRHTRYYGVCALPISAYHGANRFAGLSVRFGQGPEATLHPPTVSVDDLAWVRLDSQLHISWAWEVDDGGQLQIRVWMKLIGAGAGGGWFGVGLGTKMDVRALGSARSIPVRRLISARLRRRAPTYGSAIAGPAGWRAPWAA
jgi:hypothetical protein